MTDIPFFTGAGGLSTLVLRGIPDKKTAHVVVRACEKTDLTAHLALCAGFCRSAGAKSVYASLEGGRLFEDRAPDYELLLLRVPIGAPSGPPPLNFEALDTNNADAYMDIYNQCFASLPGSAGCREKDVLDLLEDPSRRGLLWRRGGAYIAVAELLFPGTEAELRALAVLPEHRGGTGALFLAGLMALAAERGAETLNVNVMSTNATALRLYEKAGFTQKGVVSAWFSI